MLEGNGRKCEADGKKAKRGCKSLISLADPWHFSGGGNRIRTGE